MKKIFCTTFILILMSSVIAQQKMTPELLWKLGRVSALGLTSDGNSVVFKVSTPNVEENKMESKYYTIPVKGGASTEVTDYTSLLKDKNLSPNGKYLLYHEEVKIDKVHGKDFYPSLTQSDVQIYDGLDYRHWDTWNEGKFNHVMYRDNKEGATGVDIMKNEPHHAPQKPFGGDEDYCWSPDGKKIVYVSKKKSGTAAATSTNTDVYEYNLETQQTINLTENNPGYDTHPVFSPQGHLTWLQMKRNGYEADKNDIIVRFQGSDMNLTGNWDGTVDDFKWSPDGKKVYFTAPIGGTKQLFEVNFPGLTRIAVVVRQITDGDFDVNGIVGFSGDHIVLTRQDMNHATEIYTYHLKNNTWNQITKVNNTVYDAIGLSKTEKRWVTTTDGKKMLVWVIYPPDFDPNKKYPTLLYCQGGPQGALSQFYSFRWNFQVMAAQGYIVVAPNRRGMPGHGVEWNEQISKDWGGQAIDDYLSAIDDVAKEPFVDKSRLG
ncbi:MAG: S9 family peptidase, partial [Flavobacterium sp.]